MPEVVAPPQSYSVESIRLDAVPDSVAARWEASHVENSCSSPMHDLEWLRGYFASDSQDVVLYCVSESDRFCGLAAFIRRPWPLRWCVGEFTIARLPLNRLRLLGGTVNIPSEESAYDAVFHAIVQDASVIDAVFLEEVPLDSFLWKYLHESPVIRNSFSLYHPEPPSPHPLLRFEGTFEEYMGKFSSKHRKNLNREMKKLRDGALGPMQFERFERPDEVDAFLQRAVDVSKKTYQWNLYQQGLSNAEKVKGRLAFAARHGWMRSYLLSCGGNACAFLVGFQHHGRFILHDIGFDPSLARYSVGTVLQFLAVEDLFGYNRPEVLDLGDYGGYKETLSTESYVQGKLFLFRKGAYGQFVRTGHRCCEWATRTIASSLDRLHLKATVRQRVRGFSRAK